MPATWCTSRGVGRPGPPHQLGRGADAVAERLGAHARGAQHVVAHVEDHHRVAGALGEEVGHGQRAAEAELALRREAGRVAGALLRRAAERAGGAALLLQLLEQRQVGRAQEDPGLLPHGQVDRGDLPGERIGAVLDHLLGGLAGGVDQRGLLGDRDQLHVAAPRRVGA